MRNAGVVPAVDTRLLRLTAETSFTEFDPVFSAMLEASSSEVCVDPRDGLHYTTARGPDEEGFTPVPELDVASEHTVRYVHDTELHCI